MEKKLRWLNTHNRTIILICAGLFITIVIIIFETLEPVSLAHQKLVGEVIQPFALSIGALLSGTAGLVYLDGWLEKQKTNNKLVVDWSNRFPTEKLNKDFEVIQSDQMQGVIYVFDKKNNKKHWIVDPETLRALGLNYSDVKTIQNNEFEKINRGDNISISL